MRTTTQNFFRARREELGLTQRAISVALDVTESSVSNWERGENLPQLRYVNKLADVYRVSVNRITQEIASLASASAA